MAHFLLGHRSLRVVFGKSASANFFFVPTISKIQKITHPVTSNLVKAFVNMIINSRLPWSTTPFSEFLLCLIRIQVPGIFYGISRGRMRVQFSRREKLKRCVAKRCHSIRCARSKLKSHLNHFHSRHACNRQ